MIAIVYPQFYGVGGIARYLDSFLSNLTDSGVKVYLITGDEHSEHRVYKNVEIIHVPFKSNRLNLFYWGLSVRKLLKKLYQENKIQYVNFHFPPLIPGLFLPANVPMILTAHTTYLGMSGNFYNPRLFEGQWSRLSIAIKSWMERCIFKNTTKVITLTEQGRQEVLAYGYKREIVVIPNGADTTKFTPDFSIKKDIDVIFCGRIELRKGSRPMVEVCQKLIQRNPDIRIAIVGYGDDDIYVNESLSAYSENIFLAGKVPFSEMISFYNRSKVYASASYYEGLPGTCLEALAMQLPAVVWDFMFYQGLVVENKTGYLVEPNNHDLMAEKIISLLNEPELAARMGESGRVLLKKEYSWEKLAKDVLEVFKHA